MLTDRQIALVEESFRAVSPNADPFAATFYARLFEIDPSVRALFAGTFMSLQRRKLMAAIGAIVSGLRFPDEIRPMMESFGPRAQGLRAGPAAGRRRRNLRPVQERCGVVYGLHRCHGGRVRRRDQRDERWRGRRHLELLRSWLRRLRGRLLAVCGATVTNRLA